MKLQRIFLLALFLCSLNFLLANEGMWLPNLLKKLNEPEMQSLGMRISADDIYHFNRASIKDAVVHFGGFCTGEIISSKGLILTNHHCGYGQIQTHSTPEKNYLEYGFWAKDHSEEIPNPGLSVTFINRIESITTEALTGVTGNLTPEERQSLIEKNLEQIRKSFEKESFQNIVIRPFYEGNEYYLFVTTTYRDVRLVGTPPSFIGKYGADTDNWVWPRHTGDFALFRIYADKDNKPAEYAEDNVPYDPAYSMKVSLDGVAEGDFVFAFGFPGRTNQYLHSAAIEQVQNILNPVRVAIRDRSLAIIDAAMRKDPVVKIQYASKQSRLSNAWKKWTGESLGLERSAAVRDRQRYEREFNRRLSRNPDLVIYTGLTDKLEQLYKEQNPLARAMEIYVETIQRNPEITRIAFEYNALARIYRDSGEEAFENRRKRMLPNTDGFYKDYRPEIDQQVLASMLDYYMANQPAEYHPQKLQELSGAAKGDWNKIVAGLFSQTFLTDADLVKKLLQGDPTELLKKINEDQLITLVAEFSEMAAEKLTPKYNELNTQINNLKRDYMKAQQMAFPERTFSPDANGTMRVSYGKVSGYYPRDAVYYESVTTLNGVMEKYIPEDYEFNLDDKFRNIFQNKDFGKYDTDGTVPVNFIAAIHTTGGNSGSPVLNADGHLVGLLFDGAWEGVMSDIYYSEELVRSIMVDIRYVLFVMDKYAGAGHLIDEMEIITTGRPKSSQDKQPAPGASKEIKKQDSKRDIPQKKSRG